MSSLRSRSGGRSDREHPQAVVEVLAELARAHETVEALVAGADDAHVHLAVALAADRADLALLERPQQLLLHVGAHVGDLVEEERALVGELEEALLVPVGPGEGAASRVRTARSRAGCR